MPWFTRNPPRGIEIPRLITAAHEIGHYIAFQHAGVKVLQCALDDDGEGGANLVDDPAEDQHHGYLVAVMAGAAGEKLWCETFGQRLPKYCKDGSSYQGDRDEFQRHQRRNRAARGISTRTAERRARVILCDNAKRFRKLTEILARDGELRLRK